MFGSGSITKVGTGALTLTSNGTHAGATNASGGALIFSGANGEASSTGSVNLTTNGTLRLDNAAANNNNRLNDAAPITLNQGNLVFVGNLAAPTAETAGTLNIAGAPTTSGRSRPASAGPQRSPSRA